MAKYIHRFGTTQEFENVFYREESTEYTFECALGTFVFSGCVSQGPMKMCQYVNPATQKILHALSSVPKVGVMTYESYMALTDAAMAECNPNDIGCIFQYIEDHFLGAMDNDNVDPDTGMGDFVEITAVNSITIEGYKEPWVSYVDETGKVNFNRKPFCTIKTMVDSGSSLVLNDVTECITSAITLDELLAPAYEAYGIKWALKVSFYLGDGETNPGSIVPENSFASAFNCKPSGFEPRDFSNADPSSPYDFSNGVFNESARGKVITIVWEEYLC